MFFFEKKNQKTFDYFGFGRFGQVPSALELCKQEPLLFHAHRRGLGYHGPTLPRRG
jgi:hypothetical protein